MTWIWAIIAITGVLFAIKIAYVISTALVLPATMGALYVSTTKVRIEAFLDTVSMRPGQLLVDLGCGDGRVICAANQKYGVRAVGYELNPMAWLRARLRCIGKKGVTVVWTNFWTVDIGPSDVVFCYLFPDVLKRMADKITLEARPGTVVVSCNFPLPGFSPETVLRPDGAFHHDPIYIYEV